MKKINLETATIEELKAWCFDVQNFISFHQQELQKVYTVIQEKTKETVEKEEEQKPKKDK